MRVECRCGGAALHLKEREACLTGVQKGTRTRADVVMLTVVWCCCFAWLRRVCGVRCSVGCYSLLVAVISGGRGGRGGICRVPRLGEVSSLFALGDETETNSTIMLWR